MNEQLATQAGVIIVGLLTAGAVLKTALPKFPNRLIPAVTLVLGTAAMIIVTGDHTASGLVNAFLVATSATGIHSGIKNTFEKSEEASASKKP
jgi:hypothetical protein